MIKTTHEAIIYLMNFDPKKKWKLEEYEEKRSLNANAYFYVLQNKLALKLRIKNEELHKTLLKDYGETYQILISDSIPKEELKKAFDYYDIVDIIQKNGKKFKIVNIYLPSHKMNTKQMARLIDGVVQECEQQDIEILPPDELEKLKNGKEYYYK